MADAEQSAAPSNRQRMERALLALMAEGEKLTHDAVAARAGVSRRTVYRYFPDQPALRQAMWALLSPPGGMPGNLNDLLRSGLLATFTQFDARAPEMTVAMASPEGRAMRNAMKEQRVAAYRRIYADATVHLPEPARTRAIAALQLLSSGFAWREMRDQWGLDGRAIAAAARWAIEAMLADLDAGGGPRS